MGSLFSCRHGFFRDKDQSPLLKTFCLYSICAAFNQKVRPILIYHYPLPLRTLFHLINHKYVFTFSTIDHKRYHA